ncbi:hypothetical protein EXT48_00190 [Pseudoalteromonas sp. CO348]|uniref:DUF6482 family protein n=1 Tax=unclassified Pseudoalteromonas TaxID=194690 RepID=UPI00083E2527|nr:MULTISPECIES: DUF6482 family protein [unclassified Pseudoalteromonas]MCG7542255.1 DUF6482 family protein [Pseudoalteromonas sp. OF7H-1]ODB43505.1 hypothetical protein BB427_07415 [Pseudoalteromonas sp. BMB]RZG10355.1 hypothetical protein EXT48_00190 [Pseudoalteromonas sp. CO348]
MAIAFSKLKQHQPLQKVIVHSIDLALYQVSVLINNVEYYVTEENGEFLKAHNPLQIQKRLLDISYMEMVIRHQSAYDEMVGHPVSVNDNTLEVPFGRNNLF